MNYAEIRKFDVANGDGIRTVLFVSGCTHNCKGCFNKIYQDFSYGKQFTQTEINNILEYLSLTQVSGLTILGGEPLQNISGIKFLLKEIYPYILKWNESGIKKDIWLYSGYTFEEILACNSKKEILNYIDILVDGRFIEEELDLSLAFRGSRNQRILDVKKSLELGLAIEVEKYKSSNPK